MNPHRKEILLSAEPLGLGETVRVQCVRCMDSHPSLTITKKEDGGIVWNCYRASCEERGGHGQHGYIPRGGTKAEPAKPRFVPYTGPLRALKDAERMVLAEKVGFRVDRHFAISHVRYEPEAKRFAFPIYGPNLRRRGWVFRSWDDFVRTKALTHMDKDVPHMSWYRPDDESTEVWVVEDIPSAVRIARYANVVALCGTTCGLDYINEIAGQANSVVWALDDDATTKAVYFHRKYGALFEASRVQPLDKDPKNMTEPELRALLEVE